MASAIDTQHMRSRMIAKSFDHDPGATTAIVVSPDGGTTKRVVDMRDADHFMVGAMVTIVAAGGMTKLEIIASAAADMSSPVVVKDSGTIAADAVGDQAWQECSAEEIRQLSSEAGVDYRYAAGRITMATATDEAVATYIQTSLRNEKKDAMPATTIA